jgi:hypothetical protein
MPESQYHVEAGFSEIETPNLPAHHSEPIDGGLPVCSAQTSEAFPWP